eukprot:12898143-Prorocentrum_lima.AAC.1
MSRGLVVTAMAATSRSYSSHQHHLVTHVLFRTTWMDPGTTATITDDGRSVSCKCTALAPVSEELFTPSQGR